MKAAFLTGIETIEVRDAPEPKLTRGDDVLMRVCGVGVCGSDLHYYATGRIGQQVVNFPWVVGRECAGVVEQVGPEVTSVKVGDRVALDPLVPCGRCDQCRAGRAYTCRRQVFLGCPDELAGAMAERLVMPAECFYPIPDGMTMAQAVMVEPLSIAVWAAHFAGDTTGKAVAILGAGTMGLCTLIALRAAGRPRTVYATDLVDERLAMARRLGADATDNAATADVLAGGERVEPLGFDCVFECAGEQETLDQAAELLAPGGMLVIVGIAETDRISFELAPLRRKELTVQNVRRQNGTVAQTIDLLAAGGADVEALVTHRFALDDAAKAFELARSRRDGVIKAMIEM